MTVQLNMTLDGDAEDALRKVALRTGSIDRTLRSIGSALESSTEQRFLDETGPDGVKWVRHSAATEKARGAGADKLRDRMHLFDSLSSRVMGARVAIGYNRVYARIQHLGGLAGRGRKVKIPARPTLGVTAADKREIAAIIGEHLEAGT